MALKRLFLGSFIDASLVADFYRRIKEDFKNTVSGKWVDENNLHITHKFLGDVEEGDIASIKTAIASIADKPAECEIYFDGPSSFSLKNPRVLFIGASDKTGTLNSINAACERAMVKLGFAAEEKPFHPHITIMRMKSVEKTQFAKLVEKYRAENKRTGPQRTVQLNLIESILTASGSIYKII